MSSYPLPAAALDDRLAFVGTTGSGKTYAAGTGVERLLDAGARLVIIDPLDVWWGLRLAADGKKPGFPVVMFGGAHGDLPLQEHHGALIGETAASMSESCIVSLGGLQTKAAERRFMLAFLDAIYRKADPAKNGPFHIIFDEADLWAPQKASEPMLQSRMEEIVRRGRIKGFTPWLITQRPAVLSKDVLSQADGLVALKLTSSQDRDAIGAWIEGQADRAQGREILASLPTMQTGQGVVWLPGRDVLTTATFPVKATFDSSRTPKRGEVRREGGNIKPLDLGALKERLASVEQEAKANSTDGLRAEVKRLKGELAAALARPVAAAPPPAVAEQASLAAATREGVALGLQQALHAVEAEMKQHRASAGPERKPRATTPHALAQATQHHAEPAAIAAAQSTGTLTGPQQKILDALAWWRGLGAEVATNEQVAFIAGYTPVSTSYTKARGALRAAGLVDYPTPGALKLSEAGAVIATAPADAPSPATLRDNVLAKLTGPQASIMKVLIADYPAQLANEDCAPRAGYTAASTSYTKARGALRTLTLLDYPSPGSLRAADWLFPEPSDG